VYSAFTYYTGFKVNSGEYKVMGLAPYGEPKYLDLILNELMDLREDGSFVLDQKYFNYLGGLTMTSPAFDDLFGGPARKPESRITQREMDLARSVQDACEEIVMRMARTTHEQTGLTNLCLAGGVALNCVANGRVLREGPFERLWIQPAAGDAGGALGVAQLIWHRHLEKPRTLNGARDGMSGAYLGPSFSDEQIEATLNQFGAVYVKHDRDQLIDGAARLLSESNVVGWFNGRMEFGPRALGSRSIIGDPRSPEMQKKMNLKIKYRESFRPFAPSVLEHRAKDYFELDAESPYMLLVSPVAEGRRVPMTAEQEKLFGIEKLNVPRSDVPAITHVDYSARVQTVSKDRSPDYFDLISKFEEYTGCPLVVNTSFNVRGEPIVCTPSDAYVCFMRTDMDYLVVGPYLLDKRDQPELVEEGDWRDEFELD
jgi:carbamoyltransferase